MTEYKRLCDIVARLRTHVDALVCGTHDAEDGSKRAHDDNNDDKDVVARYTTATALREDATAAAGRLRKLVARARETNPERQLYNETMCGKIEQLFAEYCQLLARMLSHDDDDDAAAAVAAATLCDAPESTTTTTAAALTALLDESALLRAVDAAHDAYMLRCAAQAAWRSRVAHDIATLVAYERDGRVVVAAAEKQARLRLRADADAARDALTRQLRERAEARWRDECTRRDDEQARLRAAAAAVCDEAGGVVAYVHQRLAASSPSLSSSSASLSHALPQTVLAHLHALVHAVLCRPEDIHIRRLRCNNTQLMHAFGHRCLVRRSNRVDDGNDDGNDDGSATCVCRVVCDVAEVVWCYLGYMPEYTNTAVVPLLQQLREGACADVTLPCGAPLSQHAYVDLGHEAYAERFVVLHEPDAVTQPDVWMAWYTRLQEASEQLLHATTATAHT